ncbi:3592_t:CDS:2 [Funneliformis caledonium]|uniref:3592_t:CDS:1 n=1 Tax=Funneliformis caledonium TaxID=1117310 RepID=A0A9N9BE38_9GLOM|nr:3592_t:CDS:2 [Funneliformis caledonium]
MKIRHLLHDEFDSSQETLSPFDFQQVSPSFLISSDKQQSSEMLLDQGSSSYDFAKPKELMSPSIQKYSANEIELPQFFNEVSSVSLDNEEKETSKSNSFIELPPLQSLSNFTTNLHSSFNSPFLVPSKEDILLKDPDLWSQFYRVDNEMIITKAGRCIFPLLKFQPVNLNPTVNYSFVIDFVQVSANRYRYKKGNWVCIGLDKRRFLSNNFNKQGGKLLKVGSVCGNPYTHPDSPQSGAYWMNFGLNFPKIKLTNRMRLSPSKAKKRRRNDLVTNNNMSLPAGHFYLTTFHKYQPRVKMIKHSALEDQVAFYAFEEMTFIAVTHYQNEAVNALKKCNNPHAKGFKESLDQDVNNNTEGSKSSDDEDSEVGQYDENNEVDLEEISDSEEDGEFYNSSLSYPTTSTTSQSNNSTLIDQRIQQWRQTINNETISSDDVFRTNRTNLYENKGEFRAKVVKNAHNPLCKQIIYEHPSEDKRSDIDMYVASSRQIPPPTSISSRNFDFDTFSSSGYNNKFSTNSDNDPYWTDYGSQYKTENITSNRISKQNQPIIVRSFPHPAFKSTTPSVLAQRTPYPRKYDTEKGLQQQEEIRARNTHAPESPLSPGNIFFSTISNHTPSNVENSTSHSSIRLEQVKDENKRLREFIRERYGVEAEREADVVVSLGGNEYK